MTQLTKSKISQIQFTKKTKKLKNLFLSLTLTCQQIWLVKIKQLLAAKPPLARDLVLVRLMQVMLVHHSWLEQLISKCRLLMSRKKKKMEPLRISSNKSERTKLEE